MQFIDRVISGVRAAVLCTLVLLLEACSDGSDGATGPTGPPGATGPSIPIIQSLSATGVPAARGGRVEVICETQSPGGGALSYAWTISPGWTIESGADAATIVLIAPAAYDDNGSARVTVTDEGGRTASGLVSLRTVANSAPIVQALNVSPTPMTRGATFSASVVASDANDDALSYQWTLPPGFTLVSGQGQATITARAERFASGDMTVLVSDGTASSTASDYLRTREGEWQNMRAAQTNFGNRVVDVAMNDAGRVVALTANYQSANADELRAPLFEVGQGWRSGAVLGDIEPATGANVVMEAGGHAIAVRNTSDLDVETHQSTPVSAWNSYPNTGSGNFNSAPHLAMNSQGDAVLVYLQDVYVIAQRYLRDGDWQFGFVVHAGGSGAVTAPPKVAFDDTGKAIMVVGRGGDIWASRSDNGPGQVWGDAVRLDTGADPATDPQIAIDAAGNAIVVWTHGGGSNARAWSSRYTVGSGWSAPSELMPGIEVSRVRIASNRDGVAMAVWGAGAFGGDIIARRFVPGTGWEESIRIDVSTGGSAAHAVAIDGVGNAFAVWRQQPAMFAPGQVVWVNRYDAVEGWSGAQTLDFFSAVVGDTGDVAVATNSSGTAVVLWGRYESDGGSLPDQRTVWSSIFQ